MVTTAPLAAAAPPAGGWAPVDSAAIRPGVVTETAGGGACTCNFVFTSGDRVFLGQAAHCAGTGRATETNGCDAGSGPIGTPVTILARDGSERSGTLAYSSWLTMQETGERNENLCEFNDFALVELDADDVADVNPTLPVFGGPTGLDTDGLALGEQVFSYGNSPLRMGVSQLSPKRGTSVGDAGEGWSHEVVTATPGVPGDSGSGYLDSGGRAVRPAVHPQPRAGAGHQRRRRPRVRARVRQRQRRLRRARRAGARHRGVLGGPSRRLTRRRWPNGTSGHPGVPFRLAS